jgi:hypothetical protein
MIYMTGRNGVQAYTLPSKNTRWKVDLVCVKNCKITTEDCKRTMKNCKRTVRGGCMEGLSSTCHSASMLLALWRRASCLNPLPISVDRYGTHLPSSLLPTFPPTSSFEALSKFQTPTIQSGSYSTHSNRQQGHPDVQ